MSSWCFEYKYSPFPLVRLVILFTFSVLNIIEISSSRHIYQLMYWSNYRFKLESGETQLHLVSPLHNSDFGKNSLEAYGVLKKLLSCILAYIS